MRRALTAALRCQEIDLAAQFCDALIQCHDLSIERGTRGTLHGELGSEAGEFRVFKGVTRRAWRPFKAIEVSREGVPTLVRFTEDEIAEAADLAVPADLQPPDAAPEAPSPPSAEPATPSTFPVPILFVLAFVAFVLIAKARRRRRG